jgi:hypothetical protein
MLAVVGAELHGGWVPPVQPAELILEQIDGLGIEGVLDVKVKKRTLRRPDISNPIQCIPSVREGRSHLIYVI